MIDIVITCHPQTDPQICMFEVGYDIYPGKRYNFRKKEDAVNSPLIKRLFAISGIEQVFVDQNALYITKNVLEPWGNFAKKIGAEIRGAIAEESVLVSPELELPKYNESELIIKIQTILDTQINPGLAMHGGYVSLVDIKESDVYVELSGGCQGCSMAMATMKSGIENTLKREFPNINAVHDVTNHEQGQNPYFN